MRCEDVSAQLADYLAGTLDDAGLARVRGHLTDCAACRAEVDEADDTWQLLGSVAAERPDGGAMRARFQATLDGYAQALADARPPVTLRDRLTSWRLPRFALQAAAAVVLLAAGVMAGRQGAGTAPSATEDQIAALREELGGMRQMVTLSLLQQQSASERLRGVTFTTQILEPGNEVVAALLEALKHDANVNVRLASVDALRRFADRETVRREAIEALPLQRSPLVQIALIDFVLEATGPASAAALRRLSTDEMLDEAVRLRAAKGLQQLGVKS